MEYLSYINHNNKGYSSNMNLLSLTRSLKQVYLYNVKRLLNHSCMVKILKSIINGFLISIIQLIYFLSVVGIKTFASCQKGFCL